MDPKVKLIYLVALEVILTQKRVLDSMDASVLNEFSRVVIKYSSAEEAVKGLAYDLIYIRNHTTAC